MRRECLPMYLGRCNHFIIDHSTDVGRWVRQVGFEALSSANPDLRVSCHYHLTDYHPTDGFPCDEHGRRTEQAYLTHGLICLAVRWNVQRTLVISYTPYDLLCYEYEYDRNVNIMELSLRNRLCGIIELHD